MKLTIHIGTEKTGTTSIQAALAKDRARLAGQGVLFPKLFGSPNHMELAVAASDPNPRDELQMIELRRQNCGHDEYRERIAAQIADEIGDANATNVVVSNEHCHSRLRGPAAVRRLIDLFGIAPEQCRIVVYLRRQDRLAVSLYSTVLKLGGASSVFPETTGVELPYYFDLERVLDTYAQVVGRERIRVRLYEPGLLLNNDVVTDFYNVAGLGIEPSISPRQNESLSMAQAIFLRAFNERFPLIRDGAINPERGPIFEAIRNVGLGDRFRPAKDAAMAFYEQFRDGNVRVRAAFLPDLQRDTLFDEDFSEYPDASAPWQLTDENYLDFVSAIWRFRQRTGR